MRNSTTSQKADSPARRQKAPIRSMPGAALSRGPQTEERILRGTGSAAGARSLVQVAEDLSEDPAIPALCIDREDGRPGHCNRQ